MPRVRLPEDAGPGSYRNRSGLSVQQGEAVDVGEETAASLVEDWGFERVRGGVTAPLDPSGHTVEELRDALETGDYGGSELHALAAEEERGKNRETAIDTIEARIPGNAEE